MEGVRLLGPSKWAEIKKLAVGGIADLLASRSAVDLKDKWRNLARAVARGAGPQPRGGTELTGGGRFSPGAAGAGEEGKGWPAAPPARTAVLPA